MQIKIYFNEKPLFITDLIEGETESLQQKPGVFQVRDYNKESILNLLSGMTQPGSYAGILYNSNINEAFDAVKQHFTLIQAAGGLVVNAQNEILLIFRRGKWDLPKGKLDEGETIEECAAREVLEETGIPVEIQKPLVVTYHTYKERGENILKESHWFLMKTHQTDFTPQVEEDIEQCVWGKPGELSRFMSNTHGSITDVLKAGLPYLGYRP